MLRYIFLKLSGFTGKKEFSISSSCNQMLMFRPSTSTKRAYRREGRRNDQSRPQHKRSYSFPSRSTKSCRFLDNESLCGGWAKSEPTDLEPIRTKSSFHRQSCKVTKETTKRSSSLNSEKYQTFSTNLTKKSQDEKPDLKSKYHEMSSFDHSERYELEVARPRRSQSELVFNVFDYVAKDVDLTDYLQPNNLRPFGSTDNIYLPLLISHQNVSAAPETNPNYPQSVTNIESLELDNPKSKVPGGKTVKDIQTNSMNNLKKVLKNYRPYGSIVNKHDDLNPVLMPKITPIKLEKQKEKPAMAKSTSSKSLDRYSHTEKAIEDEESPQIFKSSHTKSSVAIEPPPFLMKRDEMFSSASFGDMTTGSKRSITNYRRLQPPWPAYSDHVKKMSRKTLVTYPTGSVLEDVDGTSDRLQQPTRKVSQARPRTASTERMKTTEDKLKVTIRHQGFKSNISQRRTLSMEHVRSNEDASVSTKDETKKTKSSVYTSKTPSKTTVAQSVVTLNSNEVSVNPSHSYAKSSGRTRPLEPKPCTGPEKKKRCFLPSKVRLKPPKCITKHYEDCVKPPPCPPRADDCLRIFPKKLPKLKDTDCECFEPAIPCENPKLKRLEFKFLDEPRVCPCVPTVCPCPPPPRADDSAKAKEKKLVPYSPGECACVEPPPMVDVPLVRLQKRCVPDEECYPKKPCVVETCEDKERADDCLKEVSKQLPILKMGDCRCVEPSIPDINPKMRRLKMEFVDPPRICPCEPCECPDAPVRADEGAKEKVKKLTVLKPKVCECVEPPPMIDVPLKRLKKKCIPVEVCWPKRDCPVEVCEDKFRADMCLVERPKKLPKIKDTDCECFEPQIPCENPRLKRLEMKFEDEPRVCPCVPTVCPCPPPLRADDFAKAKEKKLVPYSPGECACVEPPPMVDVPLVRLQKRCVPDEKCYPKKPCIVETCEDRERADDCLRERPRRLRPMQPKPCPCVDFKMKEAPKLKRLTICAPDPPRICPVKPCPPPDEKCFRADDCVPQKFKKLSPIKPGECPCIEHRMVDAKPLPRLKCVEPEECLEEDPCLDFPRADWGCWEYVQDAEGVEKNDKCKKNKDLNYKQKRKFNTDSRNSLSVDNRNQVIVTRSNKRDLTIDTTNKAPKGDNLAAPKYASDYIKANLLQNKPYSRKLKLTQDTKCSTASRDMGSANLKSMTVIKPERDSKKQVLKPTNLGRNNSLPTLFLLKELDQIPDSSKLKPKENKINKLGSILAKVTPAPSKTNSCLISANIRNLSTVVTNPKKGARSCPGTAPASSKGRDRDKRAPDCDAVNKAEKKPCPTVNKCVDRPMVMRNCPTKVERSCTKERDLICCEKKPTPNPAFSECMDEEIKPFSNTSQWSCERKEYGFEPHSRPPNEPLDSAKNRKKFSTCTIHGQDEDNEVVNYFLARYSKENSRRCSINIYDRPVKSAGGSEMRRRDCPKLADTASDVTECRAVKKDIESLENKEPKLLNQKSHLTVAGANCRKMSTKNIGPHPQQPPGSGFLRPRLNLCHNVARKNMSTLNNLHSSYAEEREDNPSPVKPPQRQFAQNPKNTEKPKCKSKKVCARFQLENCPEKRRRDCSIEPERPPCQKPQAPYPSFSELVDDELEERMTECPQEREKIQMLQPKYSTSPDIPLLSPVEPEQGRIDPKLEETCIRERLCMKNEGLTQDCKTFGAFIKPMKSKHFFKERNRDCERIEELKKLGKWKPRKKFSTYSSTTGISQKRNMCSFVASTTNKEEQPREPEQARKVLQKSRSYHALCKKSLDYTTAKTDTDLDDSSKYTGPRNMQWRIDNFQRWYRLKKISNHPHLIKKYHTCSKLKYRKFIRHKRNVKQFTTCTRVENDNVAGVVCTKLTCGILEKHKSQKQISMSTVKAHVENVDDFTQRSISTGSILAKNNKQRFIRLPLYPKPGAKKNSKSKKADKIGRQQGDTEENTKSWQPKYASVPELDTMTVPPYQEKMESSWDKECLLHFKREKKGKSWDCSAVEKPFIRLNTSNLETRVTDHCGREEEAMPCVTCGEVFMRSHRVHMRTSERHNRPVRPPRFPNPCESAPKPRKKYKLPCASVAKPTNASSPALSLWERIVNYFKAKPNCPGPDEWRKKALREKAEKAAKAAGLCICDPEEDPQDDARENSNTKGNSNDSCFPGHRKGTYRTTTRHYSSGVNWGNNEETNNLLEDEKKKQLTEKLSGVLKEDANHEEDAGQKCPDPLLESIFKEAILSRNSLSCLEKGADPEPHDECVTYSLNIIPSDINFLADCIKDPSTEGERSKSYQRKRVSDIQEYFGRVDSLSDITYDELEKVKTNNLVKELDKLLIENEKSRKKS